MHKGNCINVTQGSRLTTFGKLPFPSFLIIFRSTGGISDGHNYCQLMIVPQYYVHIASISIDGSTYVQSILGQRETFITTYDLQNCLVPFVHPFSSCQKKYLFISPAALKVNTYMRLNEITFFICKFWNILEHFYKCTFKIIL